MIWLCIALAAMAFVLFNAGAELVTLCFGFAVALCLRARAVAAAQQIRNAWNRACSFTVVAFVEFWADQKSIHAAAYVITATAWRRASASLHAIYVHLGLPHVCLSSRMLAIPLSTARR